MGTGRDAQRLPREGQILRTLNFLNFLSDIFLPKCFEYSKVIQILHQSNGGRASVTRDKTRTMIDEFSWTYRECCGRRVRECDDCDCNYCEDCGEVTINETKCETCLDYYHAEHYQD